MAGSKNARKSDTRGSPAGAKRGLRYCVKISVELLENVEVVLP